MKHISITTYLCCFVWCALYVVRKGNIILSGLLISNYDCNLYNGCEGGHKIIQEASTVTYGIITDVITNTNLSIITENDDSDT